MTEQRHTPGAWTFCDEGNAIVPAQPKRHDDAPVRIWLQWGGEPVTEDTTWCQDQINEDDVEYVRADALADLLAACEELLCKLADRECVSYDELTAETGFGRRAAAAIAKARGESS